MKRRLAREMALQSLYQLEMVDVEPRLAIQIVIDEALGDNEAELDLGDTPVEEFYITELVEGVSQRRKQIDEMLHGYLKGWSIERLARIDRQVLRLAVYEMIYRADVPPKVAINEAIDLVKRFGSEESGKFANGVLGTMIKDLDQLKASI